MQKTIFLSFISLNLIYFKCYVQYLTQSNNNKSITIVLNFETGSKEYIKALRNNCMYISLFVRMLIKANGN